METSSNQILEMIQIISHIYVNCKNHLICYIIGHDYHGHYLHAGGLIVNNYVRENKVREVNVRE